VIGSVLASIADFPGQFRRAFEFYKWPRCGSDWAPRRDNASIWSAIPRSVIRRLANGLIPGFALPSNGSYGSIGRNAIAGPGSYVINLALVRRFAIREGHLIEFRGEAFNLLNHVRLNNPTTAFTSAQFGQITSAGDPRIMQFAIKYTH